MNQLKHLKFEKSGRIAVITLDRPTEANALDPLMAEELYRVAIDCDHDPAVKAVILTGEGRFFCAGGDIKSMLSFGDEVAAGIKHLADDLHRALSTLARMRAPVIVAVNGTAAGAGLSIAISGDLVVAAESAKFTMAYSKIGLSPDGSSSYFLPRLVGLRRAQDLMFTNRVLDAAEALDWGLVTRVVPDTELMSVAHRLATQFAEGPAHSSAAIKSLLRLSFGNPLETQMEIEGRLIAACAGSADGREGVRAFVDKRKPAFE